MRFFCAIGEESQVDNKCIVYLRIMINPRCAALLRELFCGNFAGLSGIRTLFPTEVRFVINWKTNYCKLIIIIAKSVIYLFFLWAFFNPLEDLPGYPIPVPGNAGNCILESNFTSFPGGGGACSLTSLRVGASGTKRSRQRRERCTSASWNTASGTSKCNRKAWFSTPNLLWSKAIVVYWV